MSAAGGNENGAMNDDVTWIPPEKVEDLYAKAGGNRFASINRPTSGARSDVALPRGDSQVQLYSLSTPNGIKVSILLEELGVDYDAHKISIMNGEQFHSGFVSVNPNSKIPAAIDMDGPDGQPIHLFESAAIMTYFADKYNRYNFSSNGRARQEMMQWIYFQMANQGPMTGNFGHFFVYAPEDKFETREYGTARYGMEVQRICDVMDKHMEGKTYFVNEEYSLADMALFPWFDQLRKGYVHKCGISAAAFLSVDRYANLNRWADMLLQREAVQRGTQVCSWAHEDTKPWLKVVPST
jgi:GST-like protein